MWFSNDKVPGDVQMGIPRRPKMKKSGLLIGFAVLFAGCVTEGAFLRLQNRLENAEKVTVKTQKDVVASRTDSQKARDAIKGDQADIKADMIDLHMEIQELRGKISSDQHTTTESSRERQAMEDSLALQLSYLQEQQEALEARIIRIEDFFGLKKKAISSKARKPSDVKKPAPAAVIPGKEKQGVSVKGGEARDKEALSQEEAYEVAYRLYKSDQYENARTAFEEFIRRHPNSSLVDNALFWMGETFYRSGDYESAVLKYQEVQESYPKGSKAPDALLKMGFSLEKMGEPEAAVAALNKLIKAYPKASQVDLANRKIQQLTSKKTEPKKDRGNEAEQKPKEPAQEKKSPEKEAQPENPS